MRRRAADGLAVLLFGVIAASAARGRAAPPGPTGPPGVPGSVVVTIVGGVDGEPALQGSLRELLARLHLPMNDPDAPDESVVARVHIDLTSPSQATVLVTDGRTGEVRARRILPRDTSASITREEIAHAVQSAVESALIVDDRPAPPPSPPAPSATAAPVPVAVVPAPPAPPPPKPASAFEHVSPDLPAAPSRLALDVTTLAGAGPFSDGVGPVVRVGGGLVASSRGAWRPSLALTGLYAVPFQAEGQDVGSYANLVSVRATPAIELFHGPWLAVDVGAGGGFDVLSVQPRSASLPPGNLRASTSRVDPIVTAAVTAHAALASSVVFVVAVDGDVDLASRRYVFDQGATSVAVMAPWNVRPTVLLGLAFTVLGEGLFPGRIAQREAGR